ncbi:Bowman-Birk type wound-induced proteinase inhibitor WIP1-like [Panicum miliaceum]|uniref:Bowman-Birk type wound-induced proteinase inhibitor WIP1-like n=1 Tax=Panicum miliaceum TaxID=4540 RepID=A0A3L6R0Y3_PANMI|nr:Bowman-Birk type wound-induced proteinase inhibitor WIP1-like [Panicum miliaceum]
MKSSTRALLALLVLQAVLVSATMADSNGVGASAKKACCSFCNSWSGVYTCDDLLTKCAATCKNCAAVPTDKGTRYRCRDFLPEGCPCQAN